MKMSAGLCLVSTLCIESMPSWIRCCMNMNLRSMCFALRETPMRAAMLLPDVLSVCNLRLILFVRISLRKFFRCSASVAPVPMA